MKFRVDTMGQWEDGEVVGEEKEVVYNSLDEVKDKQDLWAFNWLIDNNQGYLKQGNTIWTLDYRA